MSHDDGTAGHGLGDQMPLLEAITNLATFHREHEKFYASSPREHAVALQRHSRTLHALADRWLSTDTERRDVFSPFEGAEDLNDPAALQLDGVLFMEGEGEPAEITRIKRDIRTIADDMDATGDWLASAMSASWDVAAVLLDIDDLAGVLGERHRIISNDWHAAEMSRLAGRVLNRAVDIVDRIDFTPAALREDLDAGGASARRLQSAAELISHAADVLSDSASVVGDNECRWRTFKAAVSVLVERDPPEPDAKA